MKRIYALVIAVFAVLSVDAKLLDGYGQTTIGYNPLQMSSNANGIGVETLHGVEVSYIHGFRLLQKLPLYLEVGAGIQANFAGDAGKMWDHFTSSKALSSLDKDNAFVMCRLNIPINVAWKFQVAKILALTPYVGVNLGFNLFAWDGESIFKRYGRAYTESINLDGQQEDLIYMYYPHRFQFGGQVGVRLSVLRFNAGISYHRDFMAFDEKEYMLTSRTIANAIYGTDVVKRRTGYVVLSFGFGF